MMFVFTHTILIIYIILKIYEFSGVFNYSLVFSCKNTVRSALKIYLMDGKNKKDWVTYWQVKILLILIINLNYTYEHIFHDHFFYSVWLGQIVSVSISQWLFNCRSGIIKIFNNVKSYLKYNMDWNEWNQLFLKSKSSLLFFIDVNFSNTLSSERPISVRLCCSGNVRKFVAPIGCHV